MEASSRGVAGTATTLTSGRYDCDLNGDGLVAELRASSVYLREDGTAGPVHQVDLVAG